METKWLWLILFNLSYLISFVVYYIINRNYEFLVYIGVFLIMVSLLIPFFIRMKIKYFKLWFLSILEFLHMSGGSVRIGSIRLYDFGIYILTVGDSFLFRYDQLMHFLGIFVIVLIAWDVLVYLNNNKSYLIIFFVGVGWGSLIELVEFSTVVLFGNTGVGGYYNNAIDLIFNTFGAIFGVIYLKIRNGKV